MEPFTFIEGGVLAAKGFCAAGEHLGIRHNHEKRDVMLLVSDSLASAACCYTQNLVQGAPIAVTRENVQNGYARAMVCNSGNANTCNLNGIALARGVCALVEKHAGVPAQDVIVASTGVIGQTMSLTPFENGMGTLAAALATGSEAATRAAQAIMTTDTVCKQAAVTFALGGTACRLGGMSKGSGMIAPNMATMLCFLTTDAAVAPTLLQKALSAVVPDTFNMLVIDGDTSTNDMVAILANGAAGNAEVEAEGADYDALVAALRQVCQSLCRMMAKDGEGATKLICCKVSGVQTKADARKAAHAVVQSNLVKAMIFGSDANWGRVLCAIGYSGAHVDVSHVDVAFGSAAGSVKVCADGFGAPFDEALAKRVLACDEIDIDVSFHEGAESAVAWGCDLTYDYVKINGDYRT